MPPARFLSGLTAALFARGEAPAPAVAPPPAPAAEPSLHEAALERLPIPVAVVAAARAGGPQVLFANAAARTLFGAPQRDIALVAMLRDPGVLEAVDEALFGRIESRAVYETGGAQDRVWRALARPLGDPSTGPRLALLSFVDETDAVRGERRRADFLANASHELRTPLASLVGFIETLRGHAKDDPAARDRFLAVMQAEAGRMSRLIDDLMSLSRIELNEHIVPQGEVDLAEAVADVVDALAPLVGQAGVTLAVTAPPLGVAVVPGDRDQVVQVIRNLVDNAVKYSPPRGTVRIDLSPDVAASDPLVLLDPEAARFSLLNPDHVEGLRYALISVRDLGPGVQRRDMPRLSERFYRVEGQKSGERLGTGLGLAIVKHIVNRHRGGLGVESRHGAGAAFSVWLPRA
jgi:two-component system, OmpR family, phosphate regulon sensor histidine kinase PhoR